MVETEKLANGPKGIPFFGNALQMGKINPLDYWQSVHAEFGETVKLRLGPIDVWSFASADALHDILVTQHKNMSKGVAYAGLRKLLGEGLITTDQPHWALERKRLNPIFSPNSIDKYSEAILGACVASLPELQALAARNEPVDIGQAMTRLTMRVVSKTTFGVDLTKGPQEIVEAFEFAFAFIADITAQPLRAPAFIPTPRNRKFRWALGVIRNFTNDLIKRAMAGANSKEMSGRVFDALSGIDAELLRDEVISLYFAGFETTARTMTFMVDVLARHPEILKALRLEVANAGDLAALNSVTKSLPLACDIVNETLRIYPPVAMMARQPIAECEIGGYHIPANCMLVVNPFIAQRNTNYWPEGDTFSPNPENPLNSRLSHRGAFAPFGAGPRICLGKHFAMVEMVLAIAVFAREFSWTLENPNPVELDFHGTLRPKSPIMVRLSPRSAMAL